MARLTALAGVLLASALSSGAARAGEAMFGVYAHDIDDQISIGHKETGQQIVFGVRTAALDELAAVGRPHVHLIAGINDHGGTDYLAAGLSWRLWFRDTRLYFEPGIGLSVHTGPVRLPSPDAAGITVAEALRRQHDIDTRLDLGSRVLFEPEWSLGWKATDRMSVELSWIHQSHAQLAGRHNPGLGDFGMRAVYRYGIDR
ncbi:MAG: acyloxyacyl hydrolase [Phenylobacterium sp.]